MEDSVGMIDGIAKPGSYVTALVIWVARELITGNIALALLLAAAGFAATGLAGISKNALHGMLLHGKAKTRFSLPVVSNHLS